MIQLYKISELKEYCNTLKKQKNELIIFISVKSTVGVFFKEDEQNSFNQLEIKTNLIGKIWSSYLAIIDSGNVVCDQISDKDIRVQYKINNINVAMTSAITPKKDKASIIIDKIEYAPNFRGFNIVTYSLKEQKVIDAVCFDTNIESCLCYRIGTIMNIRGEVVRLRREVKELKEQNEIMFEKQRLLLEAILKKQSGNSDDYLASFFNEISPAKGINRKIQKAGIILLNQLDDICKKHNIPYWLHFGTLLGALRHNGFIPWDDDIDVGMKRSDIEKLRNAISDNKEIVLSDKITVRTDGLMNHNIKLQFREEKIPCWVDIFIYDTTNIYPENYTERMLSIRHKMASEAFKVEGHYGRHDEDFDNTEYGTILKKYINISNKEFCIEDSGEGEYLIWAIDNFIYNPAYRSNCKVSDILPTKTIEFEKKIYQAPACTEKYLNQMYGDIYRLPDDLISHKHFEITNELEEAIDAILIRYQ